MTGNLINDGDNTLALVGFDGTYGTTSISYTAGPYDPTAGSAYFLYANANTIGDTTTATTSASTGNQPFSTNLAFSLLSGGASADIVTVTVTLHNVAVNAEAIGFQDFTWESQGTNSNTGHNVTITDLSDYSAGNGGSGSYAPGQLLQDFTYTVVGQVADVQAELRTIGIISATNGSTGDSALQFQIKDNTTTSTTAGTQASTGDPTYTMFLQAACFVAGTHIRTPEGERCVEQLAMGDLVVTATGQAKPIRWIGRRDYSAAQIDANAHLRPIVIRAGALGQNLPLRDLKISSMHAMLIDDVFVPAASLVNGVSVGRCDARASVSYLHIELEDHDTIFAEGAATETFVDDNSRLLFDNADEFYALYGAAQRPAWFSAPRIEEGYQLEAIRRRIAAQAGVTAAAAPAGALRGHVERLENGVLEGWVMDTANPGIPVELEVLVDNEVVARMLANRYRVDLDRAGIAHGCCAFTVAMPASAIHMGQVQVQRASDTTKLAVPQMADAAV